MTVVNLPETPAATRGSPTDKAHGLPGRTAFGKEMRALFGFDPHWTPLNHGSYGTVPLAVVAERNRFLAASEAAPDRFKLAEYPELLKQSRGAVAPFLGAHPDEIVFVPNATTGTNTILRNLPLERGDVVVCFSTVYGAVRKTLQSLSETDRIETCEVDLVYAVEPEAVVGKFRDEIQQLQRAGRRVKAASFDTITSMPGVVLPWEDLTKACKELEIMSIIDGAHGIGHIDLKHLANVGPDFCVSNCHKWLFAPRGCALLYVPFRNQHLIKTTYPTSHGFEPAETRESTPNYFQNMFIDVATLDNSNFCAVPHAIRFRDQVCGGETAIIQYCNDLARRGGQRVAQILGTEVLADKHNTINSCYMVNLPLPITFPAGGSNRDDEIALADFPRFKDWFVERQFNEFHTYIPVCFHAGKAMVRFSAQVYLAMEDFEWGARVLLDLCQRAKKGEWR